MDDQIRIQVLFTIKTKFGTDYSSALYYSLDEWPVDQKIINNAKQAMVDGYEFAVDNPTPLPEPTKEELKAQTEELEKQKRDIIYSIDNQIAIANEKILAFDSVAIDIQPLDIIKDI